MEEEKLGVDRIAKLNLAVESLGPKSSDPPYVRLSFPLGALPRVLRSFVAEASEAMGVAPECIATPALATCAAAIGNTCRVRLNPAWSEPSVLWAVTLMERGSLKTPAYNAALEPLRAAQRLAEERFAETLNGYKTAHAQFEAGTLTTADGRPCLEAPEEPKPVDYFTSDCTVEALGVLLSHNPRGLALTRDELSGFFGSFGAYKGGRGGDEAAYLEFYNAGTVKLNRASGKRIYVHAAALSIFGTCQPTVFSKAIGLVGQSANQVENGMAARFLLAAPEARPKRWREPKPFRATDYQRMIAELLSISLLRDADGRVEPALIDLRPEAVTRFARFVDEHGIQTAGLSNPALRYHFAKLEGVAARLALIFYLCDIASGDLRQATGVQEQHVLAGIALARWYGREAIRFYDGYTSAAEREKRDLLKVIRDHGGAITPRAMGRVRSRWYDAETAELALRKLAQSGYGEMVVEPAGPRGGRPSLRFRLFDEPRLVQAPEFAEESQVVSMAGAPAS